MAGGRLHAIVLLVLYWTLDLSEAAKILAVFPHTGKSHFFMFKPFVYELAKRGHKLTIITHFEEEPPNNNVEYVSIRVPNDTLFFNSFDMMWLEERGYSSIRSVASVFGLHAMGVDCCRKGLSHPNLQEFLKKPHDFDLAIVEFFNTDCFASLAYIFDVPLIGIFSSAMMPWHNDRFGNPDNPSYIPNHFLPHPSRMNLVQRTLNTIFTLGTKIAYRWFFDKSADTAVKDFISDKIPPVRDIVSNASLFLVNSHFTLFQPRPLVPGVIELGGIHVTPPAEKIPENILNFIEKSTNGLIIFSMGSTIRGASMPEYKRRIFQRVFSKLNLNILWKWEDDLMPEQPDNVFISKWFPQNEILAHPNTKLFITHSGLMGTEEAVYHGVPMIMMPIFGDQPLNAASCEEKGIGLMIDYYSLSEESLLEGITNVLKDERFKKTVQGLSKIFVDRPLSTMETAIYWTEYVIRYHGARHLRSAAVELPWYQLCLLDVFIVLMTAVAVLVFIVKKMLRALKKIKRIAKDKKSKKKKT